MAETFSNDEQKTEDRPWLFKKGWKGGPGRPKGSRNHDWAKLPFWMEKLEESWNELSEKDKAFIAMEAWKTLMKRVPLPASDPNESVENASKLFQEIRDAERRVIESSGVKDGLGNGEPVVHVQADPSKVFGGVGESKEDIS